MKRYYDKLADANKQIDQKFMYLFSSLGIILSLFGVRELDTFSNLDRNQLLLLGVIAVSFLIFIITFFLGIFPKVYPYPVEGSFDTLIKMFYEMDTLEKAYYQLNGNYIHFIEINEKINTRKSLLLKTSMIFYSFILFLTLILIFL